MENVSRRSFVASAAIAAAGAACTAGIRQAKALDLDDVDTFDEECDVLVCGCGTGGAPAAIEAAKAGSDVLVIEKQDWIGGEMRRCGGGVAAAGTQVQKHLGVEDSPDDFYDYLMAVVENSGSQVDPDLVRVVVDKGPELIDWLIDDLDAEPLDEWGFCGGDQGTDEYAMEDGLNIATLQTDMADMGFTPVARCHWFKPNMDDPLIQDENTENSKMLEMNHPGGTGLWKAVGGALDESGARVLTETGLTRFIVNGDGEVVGAVAETKDGSEIKIKAKQAVVLATGSFASNHEMMINYTLTDFDDTTPYGGNVPDLAYENDGSGIKAGLAIGAELRYPATVGFSGFIINGLHIDTDAHVLNVFGEPIPRLFASSNAAGGIIGSIYPVCGIEVARNMIFGRIAGQNAAATEAWE